MRDRCPRGRCPWQDRATGLCHWPTSNCPYKAEREQAAKQMAEARQIMEAVRASKNAGHTRTTAIVGVVRLGDGRYKASMAICDDGRRVVYDLGRYTDPVQAAAMRKEAEMHRLRGDFTGWYEVQQMTGRIPQEKNRCREDKGIRPTPGGRYCLRMVVNKKRIYMGTYDTKQEAVEVRRQAVEHKKSGDFAVWLSGLQERGYTL